MGTLLRVLAGFVLACLAAGLTQVLFVIPPLEVAAAPDRLAQVGALALYAATLAAMFSAPFALIAAAIGEWWNLRSAIFYVLAAILIALAGFVTQYASETAGQPTIVNSYAAAAFATTGLIAGLVYWMTAGRFAGSGADDSATDRSRPVIVAAPAPEKPATKPVQSTVRPSSGEKEAKSGSVPETGAVPRRT